LDALVEKCLNCGSPLTEPRKLKDFCNYSCRGQHSVKALDGPKYRGAYLGSKNTRRTKALQRLRKASIAGIAFERINSVTIRIDQPHKKAVGWLMEIAWPAETRQQRWVACVGNHRSEPLPLEQAKAAAKALLTTKGKAKPRDWIKELNQLAANEVDRAAIERQRRQWPLNLMGMNNRHTPRWKADPQSLDREAIRTVLETERVLKEEDKPKPEPRKGDDYPPEYYEDGFPKLPACLDRRPKLSVSEAA
jgi:hypothetical protein